MGDLMEEFDRNISSGQNIRTIVSSMAVVKGDPGCTESLDITA
jgi:hypothetical protein